MPGEHELAQSLMAMRDMQSCLVDLVARVRMDSERVDAVVSDIFHGNGHLSRRTESQASALQTTSTCVEQLSTQCGITPTRRWPSNCWPPGIHRGGADHEGDPAAVATNCRDHWCDCRHCVSEQRPGRERCRGSGPRGRSGLWAGGLGGAAPAASPPLQLGQGACEEFKPAARCGVQSADALARVPCHPKYCAR